MYFQIQMSGVQGDSRNATSKNACRSPVIQNKRHFSQYWEKVRMLQNSLNSQCSAFRISWSCSEKKLNFLNGCLNGGAKASGAFFACPHSLLSEEIGVSLSCSQWRGVTSPLCDRSIACKAHKGTRSDFRRVVLQARSSPQILGIGMAAAPGHI